MRTGTPVNSTSTKPDLLPEPGGRHRRNGRNRQPILTAVLAYASLNVPLQVSSDRPRDADQSCAARARHMSAWPSTGRPIEQRYDRAKSIETNLRERYFYSERVQTRPVPLNGFLFRTSAGIASSSPEPWRSCANAGDPGAWAGASTPGSYNRTTGEYRVRDLDAHSWVEVYFTGIGWCRLTHSHASPAENQLRISHQCAARFPTPAAECSRSASARWGRTSERRRGAAAGVLAGSSL